MKPLLIILLTTCLLACTAKQESAGQSSEEPESAGQSSESYKVVATKCDTITTTPPDSTETVTTPIAHSDVKHFTSDDEAYDVGYDNGYQEGYSDAIHHLSFGCFYDDEPEYLGFVESYQDGYKRGYRRGYHKGLEWNAEND